MSALFVFLAALFKCISQRAYRLHDYRGRHNSDLYGEFSVGYQAIGLRLPTPRELKKCAVYSRENELAGPPFIWNAPDHKPTK